MTKHYLKLIFTTVLISLLAQANAFAGRGDKTKSIHTPQGGSPVVVGDATARDSIQLDPLAVNQQDYNVKNRISFGVDIHYPEFVAGPQLVEVSMYIKQWDVNNNPLPDLNVKLNIAYYHQDTVHSKILAKYEFSGAYRMMFRIDTIRVGGTVTGTLPKNLFVQGDIFVERYTELSSDLVSNTGIVFLDTDCDEVKDGLRFSWKSLTGAEEYQLEFLHITNYGANSSTIDPSELEYDFRRNATRVNTANLNYSVPLFFDRGWVAYRVRGIGVDIADPEHLVFGDWNVGTTGTIDLIDASSKIEITSSELHQKAMNWEYMANYSEQGKRSESITYYDGTLRARQAVSKNNAQHNVIVGETIYDYHGRPAIDVMPVPVDLPSCEKDGEPVMKFYPEFNKNVNGDIYTQKDFDKSIEGGEGQECAVSAGAMSTSSGASRYYSPDNPNQTLQQAYLPDAQGYPFRQILYTPDQTGRISSKGGLGPDFQIGTNRETKFLYGSPSQLELNRLFGSEAGYSEHYQKNAEIDGNGQVKITYFDVAGRVVATALAGESPTNMQKLKPAEVVFLETNHILPDGSNQVFDQLGNSISFSSSFIVTAPTQAIIDYSLLTIPMSDTCLEGICVDCVYELELSLKDDCGVNLLSDTLQHKTVGNFLRDETGNYIFHAHCSDSTNVSAQTEVYLNIGKYTVAKKLSVKEEALNAYLALIDSSSCVLTYDDFLDAEMQNIDSSICMINCDNCLQELGTLVDFVSNGLGTSNEYYARVQQCQELCEDRVSDCQMYLTLMQLDMSPGGQYAEYQNPSSGAIDLNGPLSVLNEGNLLPNPAASWRNPVLVTPTGTLNIYADAAGQRSKIYLTEDPANPGSYLPQPLTSGLVQFDAAADQYFIYPEQLFSVLDFKNAFEESWALSLVKYHPEYCYYESCIQFETKHTETDAFSSASFDNLLFNTNTFFEAQILGFITPGGLPSNWAFPTAMDPTDSLKPWDPFLFYDADFETARCNGFADDLLNKFSHFKYEFGQWYNMAEIAAYTVRCGSNFPSVPGVDCYNFGQPFNGVMDTSILNGEWSILKALYMSAKQGFQQDLAKCKAIMSCDAYNGCIGNTNFTPFPEFGHVQLTSSSWYSPFLDHGQPCSVFSSQLYRYKTKRFSDHEDAMQEDANSTAYELYLQTGQCPTAFALQNLLNELADENELTASSFNLSSTSYLPALFQANNSMYNPGTSPSLTYVATTATNTIVANWNDGLSTLATLTLNKTAPQAWTDITGIVNLFATGEHSFTAEATYMDLVNSTIEVFPISGDLSYFELNGCTFEQECESSQLALDLTTVFNVLVLDDTLQSITPVSLTTYSSPSLGSTVNLTSLYIVNAANSGNNLSIVSQGGNTLRIYDASAPGTDGLYIQFTGVSGTLSSATTGYEPIVSTGNYSFEMVVQQAVGYPVTFSGVMFQIHNGDTIGIESGNCDLPVPNKCQGLAFEVFEDLQPLLEDVLIHYNGSTDINLYSSIYTTPAIVAALPYDQTITTSADQGDTLIISADGCDLILALDTSQYVQFDNIVSVNNFELTGELNVQSAYTSFTCVGTFDTPSGFVQDTIYGSTCFSLKDCHPCSDSATIGNSALRQIAVPVSSVDELNGLMASLDEDGFGELFVAAPYDTAGCSVSYTNYLTCVNNFNQSYSYYNIDPITQSAFVAGQYCHCVDAYCDILNELVANDLQFPTLDKFKQFVSLANACKNCTEYATYVASVGYYNTHTTTYQILDTISPNLFNAYGYCKCVKTFDVLLASIISTGMDFENQEHFDNYASIARICSDDHINDPVDPCKIAYESYINCTINFLENNTTAYTVAYIPYQEFDSLGLCNCVDAYCSALDAAMTGIETFESQTDFDNYIFGKLNCSPVPPCSPAPSTGVLPDMPVVELENDCIAMQVSLAVINAQNAYNQYLDSINSLYRQKYLDHCMKTQEKLYTNYYDKQHHYMLYYYDVAGNLVKTVPPEGVELLPILSTNDNLNIQINQDRNNKTRTVFTSHRLQTRYEYNSVNKLISQYTPDADPMLAFEQNLPNGLNSKLITTKIQMINESLGYLAGYVNTRGYLYKTTDGGKTWMRITNLVGADLKKIIMLDDDIGVAIGQAGTVLKTIDGGQSWEMVITWSTPGMIESLNDVAVVSPTSSPVITVVGDNGLAARCTNFTSSTPSFTISNTGLSGNVMSIEVLSGTNLCCTAYDPVNKISRFYRFTTSWIELPNVKTNNFSDVNFYAGNKAYAADLDGRVYSNTDVSSSTSIWIHQSSNIKDSILKIKFFDQQQGISLVQKSGQVKLFRTIDAAKNWSSIQDSSYTAIAISKNNAIAAAVGKNKRVALILPYLSGTDQVIEVAPPAAASNFTAVWVEQETSGNVRLIVADNQRIFYTQNALTTYPSWSEYNYSSIGTSIVQMDAELMPGGYIYGVAITSSGQAWKLKRETTPEVQLNVTAISGSNYSSVTKGDNYFYLSTSSGTGLISVNMDATTTTSGVGTLPFTSNFVNAKSQRIIAAGITGDIAFIGLNTPGTSISTSNVHTKKIYPDRINRLKKDVTLNKLLAFGDDGLVYHYDGPTATFARITNQVNENINDAFVDDTEVYIVGTNGLAKKGTQSSYNSLILQDMVTNSGQIVRDAVAGADLFGVTITPAKRLYIVGGNGALLYSPLASGTGMLNPSLINQGAIELYGVAQKTNSENVLITGANARIQEMFGSMPVINQNVFVPPVTDIHFKDASAATLIAKNYVVRNTTDGGAKWNIIKPQGTSNPTAVYNKVWTVQSGKSLLFGNGNTLVSTNSSGTTAVAFTSTDVKAVNKGTSDQNIFLVDGNTVQKVTLTTLAATTIHTMSGSNPVTAIHTFTNGDHIVIGNAGLYKHFNASGTVLSYSTGLPATDFKAIAFFDNLSGIIVGNSGLYYRTVNPTVSTSGYLLATQWQTTNLNSTDPLTVSNANIYSIALTSATGILIGGENPSAYSSVQYPYVRNIYDAGGRYTARFYYDRLGRMVVTRDSRQEIENKYTYTLYDDLGRVYEVGEKTENEHEELRFKDIFGTEVSGYFSPSTISDERLLEWITASGARTEVTRSYYDDNVITGLPSTLTADITTQRLRVIHSTFEQVFDGDDQTYDHATHYRYDIHGNVTTLVQDNQRMATSFPSLASQRFKELNYSYDLMSGNVHRLSVQTGEADQWHQAFVYDRDNNIRKVYSNTETPLTSIGRLTQDKENELSSNADWQKDAHYYFYDHGKMARLEIGQNNSQGVDYYYSIHGWLKGVNSSVMDHQHDPGKDSDPAELNALFAKDVYGFGLHFYQGDYTSVAGATPQASVASGSEAFNNSFDMFNGNVRYMQTAIVDPANHAALPMLNAYKYDQLNRLVESRSFEAELESSELNGNEWNPTSYGKEYFNVFEYDAMGNILHQRRFDRQGTGIEELYYKYQRDDTGNLLRNRLYHVNDLIGNSVDSTDIDDMGLFEDSVSLINQNNNYVYDVQGRLLKDVQAQIDTIIWTATDKIKEIRRTPGSGMKNLIFDYDAQGHRIAKHVYNSETFMLENSTYYVLDLRSNQMSTYEHHVVETGVNYYLTERNIFGASRIGTIYDTVNMFMPSNLPSYGMVGNRGYELRNHLGNVLVTANDIVYPISSDGSNVDSYQVGVNETSDYSPFGVRLDGRSNDHSTAVLSRYGFQAQEKDDEIKGAGNSYNFEYRMDDPRLGRFFATDPLEEDYAWNSPYAFSENRVLDGIEFEGMEFTPLLSAQEPVVGELLRGVVDGTAESGKLGEIGTKTVETAAGPAKWNARLGPLENLQRLAKVGNEAHRIISRAIEFTGKYTRTNKKLGEGARPDGWDIDMVNKVIRIGEIKSATKTGIRNGLSQLARYTALAKELYPDYVVETELWLYKSIIPINYTVVEGDNLSTIAEKYGQSLDRLYELNPKIDKKTGLIKVGQEVTLERIDYSLPDVNIQYCGSIAFDSNKAKKIKDGVFKVDCLNCGGEYPVTVYRNAKSGKYYLTKEEANDDKAYSRGGGNYGGSGTVAN